MVCCCVQNACEDEGPGEPWTGLKNTVLLVFVILTFGRELQWLWKGKERIQFFEVVLEIRGHLLSLESVELCALSLWTEGLLGNTGKVKWFSFPLESTFLHLQGSCWIYSPVILSTTTLSSWLWFSWSTAKCRLVGLSLPIYSMFSCDWWRMLVTSSRMLPGLQKRMSKW